MIKNFFGITIFIFATSLGLFAQDSTKSLTFSGSVDGYYRHNFSAGPGTTNNKTSFTNSQSAFALGMATLRADATALSGKVTATADLGFGTRAEEFSYYESATKSSLAMVKQLYLTYALSKNVKLTAGKFATHVGYEVMDAPLNRNYSMSYMFTNGPFSHTGVKMDVTEGPVGFMVGVANFIDQTTSTTSTKTLIAQFNGGSKNGKLKAYLNYAGFFGSSKEGANPTYGVVYNAASFPIGYVGLKSLSQFDLVVNATLTDKFGIGFNATTQSRQQIFGSLSSSGSWQGYALYLNLDPTPAVGLTLRSEYISDSKLIFPGAFGAKSIFANTLSLNYKVGPFTFIPEIRVESAQSEIFTKSDGTGSKSTATALLAAVYKF